MGLSKLMLQEAKLVLSLFLAGILIIASITDFKERKVPNWLTFPAMILGLALNTAAHQLTGLGFGMLGLLVGGLIFFPFFWVGGIGAGDIKLMAVIGAFMGWVFVLNTALYTALIGGVAALIFLIAKGELGNTLKRMWGFFLGLFRSSRKRELFLPKYVLPYAVIISAGAAAAYFLPPLLPFA